MCVCVYIYIYIYFVTCERMHSIERARFLLLDRYLVLVTQLHIMMSLSLRLWWEYNPIYVVAPDTEVLTFQVIFL